MLNLKKGLALVLAAATAFTFAPVANLGNAVQAEAAGQFSTKYTLPYSVYSQNQATVVSSTNNQTATGSVGATKDGKGFVLMNIQIQARKGATYHLSDGNQTGTLKALKSSYTPSESSGEVTAVKDSDLATASDVWTASNGYLTVNIYVTAPGNNQTIVFADDTKDNSINADATLTLDLADHQAEINGMDVIKSTQKADSTKADAVDLSQNAQYPAYNSVKNVNNNNVYELQLNDGYNYYITGLGDDTNSTTSVTAWNGVKLSKSGVTVEDYNHYLTFENVYASTDTATNGFWSVSGTNHDKVVKGIKRVVAHASTKSSTYQFTVKANTSTTGYSVEIKNDFTVSPSDNAIDKLTFTYGSKSADVTNASSGIKVGDSTVTKKQETVQVGQNVQGSFTRDYWTADGFDTLFNNKGALDVTAESNDISFKSGDTSKITVDDKGNGHADFTAVGVGTTSIFIFVTGTDNNNALVTRVEITVNPWATDSITAPDTIDLDVPSQKASNAKTSEVLAPTSAAGSKVTMKLTSGDCISFNDTTGQINSKEITGAYQTATILLTTPADNARHIKAGRKEVTVRVWTLPAAQATLKPLVVKNGENVSLTSQLDVTTPNPYSAVWTNPNGSDVYTLSNPQTGLLHNNDQMTSRLFANKVGTADYQVEILGTSTTRPTTLKEKVTVTDSAVTNVITPDDNSKSVVLEVGSDPVTINVKSSLGTDVTFDDSKLNGVATVAAGATSGSAIVTAVKAGKGVIVAKSTGASDYEIPVVVTEKQQTVAPAKVTGVKVSNKKGAYVTVKWDSQEKNINYRVYKKVGNGKWVGKNVAGSKTTLSVKKGAKVQVKVKSYVKDSTGKTTWGPAATKAKTFKTDKK